MSAEFRRASPVGWNCSISMSRSSSPARQHIAIPSPVFSRAGAAIRYIVAEPPVATTTTRAEHEREAPGSHVEHREAGQLAVSVEDEVERADVLELARADAQHLVAQAAHDLDAGQVAPVDGPVEALAGERLLVERAVRCRDRRGSRRCSRARGSRRGASLTSAQASSWSLRNRAALERVGEVQRRASRRVEHRVVAALDHARAAGSADGALARRS